MCLDAHAVGTRTEVSRGKAARGGQDRPLKLNFPKKWDPMSNSGNPVRRVCESVARLKQTRKRHTNMKFICLGYIEPNKLQNLPESVSHAMMDECFSYDDELRKNGNFAAGQALQGPQSAKTL